MVYHEGKYLPCLRISDEATLRTIPKSGYWEKRMGWGSMEMREPNMQPDNTGLKGFEFCVADFFYPSINK